MRLTLGLLLLLNSPLYADVCTFVVIPDTQKDVALGQVYVEQGLSIAGLTPDAIFHVGDITDGNTPAEWLYAETAATPMFPELFPAEGNHDIGPGGSATDRLTLMDDYYGADKLGLKHRKTFEGGVSNSFYYLRACERDWIVLTLEFGPRDAVMNWADEVLARHENTHRAIIVTHAFTFWDGTIHGDPSAVPPHNLLPDVYAIHAGPGDTNNGWQMWQTLKTRKNVALILSGHVINASKNQGIGYALNDAGLSIPHIHSNYQTENGVGWYRVMTLDTDQGVMEVRTYSPILLTFREGIEHDFLVPMDLSLRTRPIGAFKLP